MLYQNAELEPAVQHENDIASSSLLMGTVFKSVILHDRLQFGMLKQHVECVT